MEPNLFQKVVAWMLVGVVGIASLYGILFFFSRILKLVGLVP